jgi:hypothetical protein
LPKKNSVGLDIYCNVKKSKNNAIPVGGRGDP